MSILFGHPTGNPNSYNAAMAYLEVGLLECFCVTWMPSNTTIGALKHFRPLRPQVERLERRLFSPLSHAPKVQGRVKEVCRLLIRASGLSDYPADQASRWLMRTMARECHRSRVTAVHAYEDCSLWQFMEAKRLGKACVYDMPTCYYPAWERIEAGTRPAHSGLRPAPGEPGARGPPPGKERPVGGGGRGRTFRLLPAVTSKPRSASSTPTRRSRVRPMGWMSNSGRPSQPSSHQGRCGSSMPGRFHCGKACLSWSTPGRRPDCAMPNSSSSVPGRSLTASGWLCHLASPGFLPVRRKPSATATASPTCSCS